MINDLKQEETPAFFSLCGDYQRMRTATRSTNGDM